MKKITLLFILSWISIISFSQNSITNKTNNFGPNKTHFIYSFIGLGIMSPPKAGEGADIIYGNSKSFIYGIKYKYRISNIFSVGTGLNYNFQSWHLQQNNNKIIPTTELYDKEKIVTNNFGSEFFIRINIGKRDSTIGRYIDIAPYGEWAFKTSRETKIISSNNTFLGEEYNTTSNINLNYIGKFNYGLQLKFALGRFALTGKYRLSNLFTNDFKTSVSNTELPRLILGIEIGLHE